MGNLEYNHPISYPYYPRKPIFNQDNTLQSESFSKAYSVLKSRTPRHNPNKSLIYTRYEDKSPSPRYNNKVYLNSRMIKSVIKDSSQQERSSISYLPRNNRKETDYLNSNTFKNHYRAKPQSKEKYIEKSFIRFNEISDKVTHWNKSTHIQKQNLQENISKINGFQIQPQQNFNERVIIHKCPIAISKVVKSGNSTGRGFENEPQADYYEEDPSEHRYHKILEIVHTPKQFQDSTYDVPTERKKPVRISQNQSCQCHLSKSPINKFKPIQIIDINASKKIIGKENQQISLNLHKQNRQKCQQIIKRVRNFNEFLNEVKRKIKKEADSYSQNNNTTINEQGSLAQYTINSSLNQYNESTGEEGRKKGCIQSKSITMALKLENQKIELQKYRKLVQRQLSKQHSIESIEIEGGRNKQKIITINFQKKIEKVEKIDRQQKISKSGVSIKNEKNEIVEKVQAIKKLINSKENLQKFGRLDKIQVKQGQPQQINRRVSNINKLMSRIEGIHNHQNQNCRKIYEILNKSSPWQNQDEI